MQRGERGMHLTDMVFRTPLLRPNTIPNTSFIGVACFPAAIPNIPAGLLERASGIFVFEKTDDTPESIKYTTQSGETRAVPVLPYDRLKGQLCLEIVFFNHEYNYKFLVRAAYYLRQLHVYTYYNACPLPYNRGITTTHLPTYYDLHKESLEQVFSMLKDDESKQVMAARIRALETGNIGYVGLSKYPEYFHPEVQPTEEDVVLDGGVSENILSQVGMSKAVGPNGKI